MNEEANGKLRRSFAIAGAAVVLPLLAVFAFNTLWGYLPLRRDVGAVPHFVNATNSMRDLEIAVLQSALPVHGRAAGLAARASVATPDTSSPAPRVPVEAEAVATEPTEAGSLPGLRGGEVVAMAEAPLPTPRVNLMPAFERAADLVAARFAIARDAVRNWPAELERTYELYAEWAVVREHGRRLFNPQGPVPGTPAHAAALEEYDVLVRRLVDRIDALNQTISSAVSAKLERESARSQTILGLSVSIGFMVICFIMYVNLRLARYVVDPVNGMVGSILRFREGDYTARTDVRRSDEIGNLADAFNAMAEDIEQTHQHLASLSERDPLTGMLNRRGFDPRFERQLKQAEAGDRALAVVMIDIDHFKRCNDTYGHATGDLVLVAVADTIRNCLRAGDFSARFGGEEFIVCLPGEDVETGVVVAERIREAIARLPLSTTDGRSLSITASAGVSVFPHSGRTRNEIIEAGDAALYRAKEGGRNRVELAEACDPDHLPVECEVAAVDAPEQPDTPEQPEMAEALPAEAPGIVRAAEAVEPEEAAAEDDEASGIQDRRHMADVADAADKSEAGPEAGRESGSGKSPVAMLRAVAARMSAKSEPREPEAKAETAGDVPLIDPDLPLPPGSGDPRKRSLEAVAAIAPQEVIAAAPAPADVPVPDGVPEPDMADLDTENDAFEGLHIPEMALSENMASLEVSTAGDNVAADAGDEPGIAAARSQARDVSDAEDGDIVDGVGLNGDGPDGDGEAPEAQAPETQDNGPARPAFALVTNFRRAG